MIMERGIITINENGAVTIPTVPVWMTQQEMSDAFNVFGCFMMLSERLAVIGGKHPFDVRFLVENLAAQLVVGYHSAVAVILQGAAAHFQPCRHLPVREEAFIAQSRTAVCHEVFDAVQQTVKRVAEPSDQRMVLGNHFTHCYVGCRGTIIIKRLCPPVYVQRV